MLLWLSPSLKTYDDALAIVRREREKPVEKDGPPPPAELGDFRYVEAWHYSEQQILESSEHWLQDMYTCHRWRVWVENDEFERMREGKDGKKSRPIGDAEVEEIRASNPKFRDLPAAALRKLYKKRG